MNRLQRMLSHLPGPLALGWSALGRGALIFPNRRRVVRHRYCGYPLAVVIADREGKKWYDADWPTLPEIEFLRSSKLAAGATVFDLGAHQGVLAAVLANIVGSGGRVIAVDPVAHNVSLMEENAQLNGLDNLVPVEAAVARTSGTVKFSGFLTVRVTGRGRAVPGITVDDLAAKYGAPAVIVVDVEGYEVEVLAGAAGTLQSEAPPDWSIECHVGCGLEECGGSVNQIADVFRGSGYDLFVSSPRTLGEFVPYRDADPILRERFFLNAVAR